MPYAYYCPSLLLRVNMLTASLQITEEDSSSYAPYVKSRNCTSTIKIDFHALRLLLMLSSLHQTFGLPTSFSPRQLPAAEPRLVPSLPLTP